MLRSVRHRHAAIVLSSAGAIIVGIFAAGCSSSTTLPVTVGGSPSLGASLADVTCVEQSPNVVTVTGTLARQSNNYQPTGNLNDGAYATASITGPNGNQVGSASSQNWNLTPGQSQPFQFTVNSGNPAYCTVTLGLPD